MVENLGLEKEEQPCKLWEELFGEDTSEMMDLQPFESTEGHKYQKTLQDLQRDLVPVNNELSTLQVQIRIHCNQEQYASHSEKVLRLRLGMGIKTKSPKAKNQSYIDTKK